MLRVYADSNIYRVLVPAHPSHSTDLKATFDALKDKLLFSFSEAHMDDLKNSIEEYIRKDLAFMEQFVLDNYMAYDRVQSKSLQFWLKTPQQAFDQIDYAAAKSATTNPFDLSALASGFDDVPEAKVLITMLDKLFDLPLYGFIPDFDVSKMDEKSALMMNKMISGFGSPMSLRQMMNSILPYGNALLNDDKEVTELRKYIGEYLDRDTYSFEKWGLGFDEKFRETAFGKSFLDVIDGMLVNNQKDDFQLKFSYAYSALEIFNVTKEKKRGGGVKKFDFDSLHIDGMHAYYASYCDYLVTDDKGLQVKAHILYNLFGFRTKVMSSQDFSNVMTLLLGQEETYAKLIDSLKFDIEHSMQIREVPDFATGTTYKTYKTTHTYFNYFNRMQTIDDPNSSIALFCNRGHFEGNNFLFREIQLLVNKMMNVFGPDDENMGEFKMEENKKIVPDYLVRQWTKSTVTFSLNAIYRSSFGNLLCLIIDFTNK